MLGVNGNKKEKREKKNKKERENSTLFGNNVQINKFHRKLI